MIEHWLSGQYNYYTQAVQRDHRKLKNLERSVRLLVGGSMSFTVILAVVLLSNLSIPLDIVNLLITAIGLLAGGAALLYNYISKRAFSEHIKQYGKMSRLFLSAMRPVQECVNAGNAEGAKDLIRELGKEALEEHSDWLLLHRQRPVDVPHPSWFLLHRQEPSEAPRAKLR